MTTIAEFNIATLTDLDRARYEKYAVAAFNQASQWQGAVPDSLKRLLANGRSVVFTKINGMALAESASVAAGSDFTYITPSETQVTCTWDQKIRAVRFDQQSEAGSAVAIMDASIEDMVTSAGLTFDYLISTACSSGVTSSMKGWAGSAATQSSLLSSSHVATLALARKAHAKLSNAGAPKFLTPAGALYKAYVHPYVAHDLKAATSDTIFQGAENLNTQNYKENVLGVAGGFIWIESATAPLVAADAGVSNVDVYSTVFLANRTIGMCHAPVPRQPGATEVKLNPEGSMVGRITFPASNLGIRKDVGMIMNLGFAVVQPTGMYILESASSLGANT